VNSSRRERTKAGPVAGDPDDELVSQPVEGVHGPRLGDGTQRKLRPLRELLPQQATDERDVRLDLVSVTLRYAHGVLRRLIPVELDSSAPSPRVSPRNCCCSSRSRAAGYLPSRRKPRIPHVRCLHHRTKPAERGVHGGEGVGGEAELRSD
jgi:hypothetical protein